MNGDSDHHQISRDQKAEGRALESLMEDALAKMLEYIEREDARTRDHQKYQDAIRAHNRRDDASHAAAAADYPPPQVRSE